MIDSKVLSVRMTRSGIPSLEMRWTKHGYRRRSADLRPMSTRTREELSSGPVAEGVFRRQTSRAVRPSQIRCGGGHGVRVGSLAKPDAPEGRRIAFASGIPTRAGDVGSRISYRSR